MATRSLAFFALGFAACGAAATPPPETAASAPAPAALAPIGGGEARPDDIALVIGVEAYRAQLPPAGGAEEDARTFADFAVEALGVPRRNVILLVGADATRSSMNARLDEWLPRNVRPGSRVYFYFAGHGAPDPTSGTGYLVPWEADPSFIRAQGLSLESVTTKLSALPVERVVVFVDACFSGAGGRSVIAPGTRPLVVEREVAVPTTGARLALLSAAGSAEVTGATTDGRHGLFSYHLFHGLNGDADGDRDGRVTFSELDGFVSTHVADDARRDNRDQHPSSRFSADSIGTEPLVSRAHATATATEVVDPAAAALATPGPENAPPEPEGEPAIYERWWFWAGAGAVAAGAAATFFVLSAEPERPCGELENCR